MKTMSLKAHWARTSALVRGFTLVALAASAWALSTAATQAHARDNISWSIGVNSPGVAVGVSNYPPVYVNRYPVYEERYPIYEERRPIYQRPIVVERRPVVVYPQPIYVQPRPYYRSNWGHGPRWGDRPYGHGHRGHGHRGGRGWDNDGDRRGHR
jgi:hypothetical protein